MELPPFKLERYFAQYEFNVKHLLCCSDCESMSIAELLALEPGAEERFIALGLGYTESAGSPALRQAIAGIYTDIDPNQILVHAGAEEAILLFMQAALSAGDHVIVHWPCYQSLADVAISVGCEVSPWEARAKAGWALDLDELKQMIRPATRVIVINTPHNPTGWLMARQQFGELLEIADQHGILVFSDEVYRESEYDPAARLPAACDLSPGAVSLGVTSKTYGLPGLRIGWIATRNRQIYQRMAGLKDYTTICNSAPSEFLAEIALGHRQYLIQRNVAIIQKNLDLLDQFFPKYPHLFKWQRPAAGPIAFPRWLEGDVGAYCDDLVRQAGVLLLPGILYDHPGNHFRIGFGRRNLPEALSKLEAYLRR
ncbi:MAG: aminotransferase class I/II-fold pyridoxal phosphate-dependent enzyme [Desulfobacterales bacterium]